MLFKSFLAALALFAAAAAHAHVQGPPTALALAHEDVIARIRAKIAAGDDSREALAPEFAEIDALFAGRKPEEDHDAGDLLVSKLGLTLELFDAPAEVAVLMQQIQTEFPDAESGTAIASALAGRDIRNRARAAEVALLGQAAPILTFQWANRTGLSALADLRGSVVVLDFWATSSRPSIRAFPAIRTLAERYEGRPVVLLSVTRLQGSVSGLGAGPIDTAGDPARERELLAAYARERDLTWTIAVADDPAAFDAFAVSRLPTRVIIDAAGAVRHAGLSPTEPLADQAARIDALLAETGAR